MSRFASLARRLAVLTAFALSVPALAVTSGGARCVNGKGILVKGAYTQADCKAPYHWITGAAPQAGVARTLPKKVVATSKPAARQGKALALAGAKKKKHHKAHSKSASAN